MVLPLCPWEVRPESLPGPPGAPLSGANLEWLVDAEAHGLFQAGPEGREGKARMQTPQLTAVLDSGEKSC